MGHITAMFASEVWGMNLLTATISQVGSIANRKSSERFENHWRSKYFIPEIRCSIRENANYHDGNGIFVILFYLILPLFDCIIISFCAFFSDMFFFLTKNGMRNGAFCDKGAGTRDQEPPPLPTGP